MKLPPFGKHARLDGNWVHVAREGDLDHAGAWEHRESIFAWGQENNIPITAVDPYPYAQWRVLVHSEEHAVAVLLRWS